MQNVSTRFVGIFIIVVIIIYLRIFKGPENLPFSLFSSTVRFCFLICDLHFSTQSLSGQWFFVLTPHLGSVSRMQMSLSDSQRFWDNQSRADPRQPGIRSIDWHCISGVNSSSLKCPVQENWKCIHFPILFLKNLIGKHLLFRSLDQYVSF